MELTVAISCNVISLCSLMNYNQMGAENKLHLSTSEKQFLNLNKACWSAEEVCNGLHKAWAKGVFYKARLSAVAWRQVPSTSILPLPATCPTKLFRGCQQLFHVIFLETRILQKKNIPSPCSVWNDTKP